jgi:hypothetical protein
MKLNHFDRIRENARILKDDCIGVRRVGEKESSWREQCTNTVRDSDILLIVYSK